MSTASSLRGFNVTAKIYSFNEEKIKRESLVCDDDGSTSVLFIEVTDNAKDQSPMSPEALDRLLVDVRKEIHPEKEKPD